MVCGVTDVPSFCEDDAEAEGDEEGAGGCPSVGYEGRGFVEVGLVYLYICVRMRSLNRLLCIEKAIVFQCSSHRCCSAHTRENLEACNETAWKGVVSGSGPSILSNLDVEVYATANLQSCGAVMQEKW